MKQTPVGVVALSLVLGCFGSDVTDLRQADGDDPDVRTDNTPLLPDDPSDGTTDFSSGLAEFGLRRDPRGRGETAAIPGPMLRPPWVWSPDGDVGVGPGGDTLDGGSDADASDGTEIVEPACAENSWSCAGRIISCSRENGGRELLRDCFSEAACSDAAQACNAGECPDPQLGCNTAELVPEGAGVFGVSTGAAYTCALLGGGRLRCWGFNTRGELGYGHRNIIGNDEVPASAGDVDLGVPVVQVVTGRSHTCALSSTGEVRCWGDSSAGKYGNGDLALLESMAVAAGRSVNVGDDEPARFAVPVALDAPAIQLAAGDEFTCALLEDGRVRCWGKNSTARIENTGVLGVPGHAGDIGDDEPLNDAFVPAIDLGGAAAFIASGARHTCAILRNGKVRCFGNGEYGKLGYGHSAGRNDAIGDNETPASAGDVALGKRVIWLSAGSDHTCAVLDGGLLQCWGEGASGKLGYDDASDVGDDELPNTRRAVDLGHAVKSVSAAQNHTCALLSNQTVRCWGNNAEGALGGPVPSSWGGPDPSINVSLSIALDHVDLGNTAIDLDAQQDHSCAILSDRQLICWGFNGRERVLGYPDSEERYIGDNETPAQLGPIQLLAIPPPPPPPDVPVSAAPDASAPDAGPAEPTDSGIQEEPLDPPSADAAAPEPADAAPPEPLPVICEPGQARCELSLLSVCNAEGTVFEPLRDCFTSRVCERARPSCDLASCVPEALGCVLPPVPAASRVQRVAAGDRHACAVLSGGAVRCWGENGDGQLGYGHEEDIGDDETAASAGDVQLGARAISVVAGGRQSCALFEGGSVRCWGDGNSGRLGRGDEIDIGLTNLPDASTGTIRLGGNAVQLSAGSSFTCALLENGDVRCWGVETRGQLGVPRVRTPLHTTDIGDDETPEEVPPLELGGPALFIASGSDHSCAILDNDSRDVRCWGNNNTGQLGYGRAGNIGDVLTPASQPPLELGGRAVQLSLGVRNTCALLEDGTVRCWGNNSSNQLGQGKDFAKQTLGDNEPPTARPALSFGQPALQVAMGEGHACVLLSDRSVRCWGANAGAQLARLSVTPREVPLSDTAPRVDVGGASLRIDAGDLYTCAVLSSGQLSCWGSSSIEGALGHGRFEASPHFRIGDNETPAEAGPVPLF